MFLKSISITNILSFGDKRTHIELRPLNILIGHNGSGKSNLIECINLLQALPNNISTPINTGGGIYNWIWKGYRNEHTDAILEAVTHDSWTNSIHYRIRFSAAFSFSLLLLDELIEKEHQEGDQNEQITYFTNNNGAQWLRYNNQMLSIDHNNWPSDKNTSILSQLKDWNNYPEITWLGYNFGQIRVYRDWSIGRNTPPRIPQRPDMPNDFLTEDCANLGLTLNKLRMHPEAKRKILENLRNLYPSAEDFDVLVEANTVQVFIQEGSFSTPATRLSDGTLRFLCLLAILCHPNPPPLICIEEPELGLHPDMMPVIADLLRDAANRTQLIVTTHSDLLVEEFTDEPECVLTFEKQGDQTAVHRLNSEELADWLKKYTLGQLRQQGNIGGNRW
jgi:predicted ATPase